MKKRRAKSLEERLRERVHDLRQIDAEIEAKFPGLLRLLKVRRLVSKDCKAISDELVSRAADDCLTDPWGNS